MKNILRGGILLIFMLFCGYHYCLGQATYEDAGAITLYVGEVKIIPVRNPVRVVVSNPNIADVTSANTEELFLIGKQAGNTNIIWWDDFGQHTLGTEVFAENLTVIKERIDAIIKELYVPGVFTRRADSEGKVLILGAVKTEKEKQRIMFALSTLKDKILDLIEIKEEETMVEISAQLIEVGKDAQRELGFNMPTSVSATEQLGDYGSRLRHTGDAILHVFQWARLEPFSVTFTALADEGKVRVLSRPKLACQSGKEAELLVGGEKPIFTTGTVSGGGSSTSVEYKEYGIKLKIKPLVTPEKNIKVGLKVEISEILESEFIGSEENKSAQASPISKRSAATELVLADGQTMVIGGLIKKKTEETISKTAGLGDIPILGALFRKKTTKHGGSKGEFGDAELFITLTPKILKLEEAALIKEAKKIDSAGAFSGPTGVATDLASVSQEDVTTLIARYTQMVTRRIKDNLAYPWAASQGHLEGVMRLSLNIASTGELLDVKITQSSGFAVLDENALSTVKKVAPFSSFPSGISQQELWIDIPIVYNLKK